MKEWKGQRLYTGEEIEAEMRQEAEEVAARGIRSGSEFKLVRKVAGLLASDVAELFGVTPESVSHWETEKHSIPRAVAFALGELLNRPQVTRGKLEALASPRKPAKAAPRGVASSKRKAVGR